MPTAETVSERTTLIIPCATNESVTTSGVANKKLDEEMCHHVNPEQYIHERIEPVCNHYSTNDSTNTIEEMDARTSGNIQHSPMVRGYQQSNYNPNHSTSPI